MKVLIIGADETGKTKLFSQLETYYKKIVFDQQGKRITPEKKIISINIPLNEVNSATITKITKKELENDKNRNFIKMFFSEKQYNLLVICLKIKDNKIQDLAFLQKQIDSDFIHDNEIYIMFISNQQFNAREIIKNDRIQYQKVISTDSQVHKENVIQQIKFLQNKQQQFGLRIVIFMFLIIFGIFMPFIYMFENNIGKVESETLKKTKWIFVFLAIATLIYFLYLQVKIYLYKGYGEDNYIKKLLKFSRNALIFNLILQLAHLYIRSILIQ